MLSLDEGFIISVREKYGEDISKINLSNNGLQDLGSIGKLHNLIKINLSKNNLQDVSALQSLKKLTELNLADNEISKIDSLEPLKSLESLDLRGNRIVSLNDIKVLTSLSCLFSIQLAGNAICLSEDYPHGVFALQDNLQYVDTWTREDVMKSSSKTASSPSQSTPVPSSNTNTNASTYILHSAPPPLTAAEGLEAQCAALREALDIQEKTMVSTQTSPVTPTSLLRQHSLHTVMKRKKEESNHTADDHVLVHLPSFQITPLQTSTPSPNNFPYLQLLARWRECVVKLNVQLQLQGKELKAQHEEFARFRTSSAQKILQLESSSSSMQLKLKSAQEREAYLGEKLKILEREITAVSEKEEGARRQLNDTKKSLLQLRSCLVHFTASVWPQLQVQLQHQLQLQHERLARCGGRVLSCQEHLGFLAHRFNLREVAFRNNLAAWEVEKKMFFLTMNKDTSTSSSSASSNKKKTSVGEEGVVKVAKLLEDDTNNREEDVQGEDEQAAGIGHLPLALSAAAESALLSVFRSLPSYEFSGTGSVCTFLRLLVCLDKGVVVTDTEHSAGDDLGVSYFDWEGDGGDPYGIVRLPWSSDSVHLIYPLQELGELLQGLLTPSTFITLLLNLLHLVASPSRPVASSQPLHLVYDEACSMTWGECLSYLLPTTHTNTQQFQTLSKGARLSAKEYADMGKELLYDELASVPPLHLPSLMDVYRRVKKREGVKGVGLPAASGVLEKELEGMTKKDLIKEVSRLRSERSLLLHQVQELSRQTLERAEGVKRYFASSLREKDALLSHTKEQLQLQTEAATAKGQEVKELRHALQELRNTHSQREQDWAGQVQDLQTQLSKFTSEREREVAKDLADARDKMERLEKECKVLRGERDRGEVKLKAKERDVLALQNTASALREEVGKKDKQLEELQRDRRDSDKEKEGLRLRLGELEAQMQALLLHQQQQS
eukprot:gene34657-41971_t